MTRKGTLKVCFHIENYQMPLNWIISLVEFRTTTQVDSPCTSGLHKPCTHPSISRQRWSPHTRGRTGWWPHPTHWGIDSYSSSASNFQITVTLYTYVGLAIREPVAVVVFVLAPGVAGGAVGGGGGGGHGEDKKHVNPHPQLLKCSIRFIKFRTAEVQRLLSFGRPKLYETYCTRHTVSFLSRSLIYRSRNSCSFPGFREVL